MEDQVVFFQAFVFLRVLRVSVFSLNPAMEPAKHAKDAKEETLRRIARFTRQVNPANLTTRSFRVLSRLSRAIHSRF